MRLEASVTAAALALVCVGCATSGAVRLAERGDFAALKAELIVRERAGSIGNGEAADIARAVASREIAVAKGADAEARVREVRACAKDVDDALESRAKTHDRAGGDAALARVESGELSRSDAREYAADANDAWRAVGASGLVRGEEDRAARQAAMKDPAPGVRRAALLAASTANDEADVDALAEAARLDPDPLARTYAVRALGFTIGGARAFAALRDLATSADDALAEDLAIAWTSPVLADVGGRDALRLSIASGHGPGAIAGAAAALRTTAADAETRASAVALLVRTIEKGPRRDRLHALAVAPLEPAILIAVRASTKDDDIDVRLSAFARLVERTDDRAASIKALEAVAGDRDRPAGAARAKMALAVAGDRRIQAWLEADLASADARVRLAAVTALGALGMQGRGAPVLADADASVRTRAACTILSASHRRR